MPILTAGVVQATCELSPTPVAPMCVSLESAEAKVLSSEDPIENLVRGKG